MSIEGGTALQIEAGRGLLPSRPASMRTVAARLQASPGRIARGVIVGVLAWSCLFSSTHAEPLAAGQVFPTLAEYALEGALPDTRGAKVVVVDFWASWCPPCRAAFPVLDGLQADFGAQGVHVIAVSVDQSRAAMDTFLKRNPVRFAVVRDTGMKLVQRVDVPTMPTTFVLDARGIVRFVHAGFEGEKTRDKLRAEITALLKEES